jgi:hypothetical protein
MDAQIVHPAAGDLGGLDRHPTMSGKTLGTAPGFRINALVETAALVAALLIADTVFGAGNRFAGLSPSPFWIPVLLASAYYGLNEGLVAAAICSLVALVGNMPEQHLNEDLLPRAPEVASTGGRGFRQNGSHSQ